MLPYLTVAEVAQVLGVSRQYVHQLVREGKLPAQKLGNYLVVPRRRVGAYIKTNKEAK